MEVRRSGGTVVRDQVNVVSFSIEGVVQNALWFW